MTQPHTSTLLTPTVVAIAEVIVSSTVHPAVVLCDGRSIIAANTQWLDTIGLDQAFDQYPDVDVCLAGFDGIDLLMARLRSPGFSEGSTILVASAITDRESHEYLVRGRRLGPTNGIPNLTLLVFEDHEEARQLASTVKRQSAHINQLLVRQTLIEEHERRRIGRALHDQVSQELAHVLRQLEAEKETSPIARVAIATIRGVIGAVSDLTFSLSPPVLEDLGLLAALRWLAGHDSNTHAAHITCADDGTEPDLTPESRIIAFRAVRELVSNAVKHAPGAEIVVSSLVNTHMCRLTVTDTGPGFVQADLHFGAGTGRRYGLLSVEQQILAIRGTFEVASTPGEGTRAVITLPLAGESPSPSPMLEVKPRPDA